MKKTIALLAAASLVLSGAVSAAETETTQTIYVKGDTQSNVVGAALVPGGTLINSDTGYVIVYDENETTIPPIEAPFDIEHGIRVKNYTLDGTLPTSGDKLVLDFTDLNDTYVSNWGYYLQDGATAWNGDEEFEVDYVVFNFDDADMAAWYSETPMTVIGKFTGGVEATAYIISDTCDRTENDSSYGGIVFFNERVLPAVTPAVPEPGTATLSLLALAGLAARRRRK